MDTQEYNGWTNYATWRVNLEIFDGFDLADSFDLQTRRNPDVYEVSKFCREYVEEHIEQTGEGLTLDYARAFLSDVNWDEIARHLLEAADWPTDESDNASP